jgi:hypothetical protein
MQAPATTRFEVFEVIMGCGSLGIVVGSMVRVTFIKQQTFNAKTLASIISVMVGGAVIGLFHAITGKQLPLEIFWYPVGLAVGYMFTAALEPDSKKI